MKKTTKVVASIFVMAIAAIFTSQYTSPANGNAAGAPSLCAGDPSSGGATCKQGGCHSGPAVATKAGWITSTIPAAGYTPGSTYVITATAVGHSSVKFGFEVSPQNSSGTVLGTLAITDPTHTKLGFGSNFVTHNSAGTTHTWSFNWTAPSGTNGSVTFYGAFNIANNDGNTPGDTIYTSSLTVPQDPSTGITDINIPSDQIKVYPNPVTDKLTIENNNSETMDLTFVDFNGRVVKQIENVNSKQAVSVADLSDGTYILNLKSKSGNTSKKIIKN